MRVWDGDRRQRYSMGLYCSLRNYKLELVYSKSPWGHDEYSACLYIRDMKLYAEGYRLPNNQRRKEVRRKDVDSVQIVVVSWVVL